MPTPRILVIEDDLLIRELFVAAFKREAVVIDTAADGYDALEKVRENKYAVLLVDLMMPRMNGIDFLTAYGALPQSDAIVIVITAFDAAAVERLAPGMSERVHAIVHKPFDIPAMIDLLRTCAAEWKRRSAANAMIPVSSRPAPLDVR